MKAESIRVIRVKGTLPTPAEQREYERASREYAKLTTEELLARSRPLTPAERERWNRARRGRPRKPADKKAARVLFTIEPGLLKKADRYAKAHGMTRAQLIAIGIRSVISA